MVIKKNAVNIRLDDEDYLLIKKLANQKKTTITQLIREYIYSLIKRGEKNGK